VLGDKICIVGDRISEPGDRICVLGDKICVQGDRISIAGDGICGQGGTICEDGDGISALIGGICERNLCHSERRDVSGKSEESAGVMDSILPLAPSRGG
jgi:hypothetical protein